MFFPIPQRLHPSPEAQDLGSRLADLIRLARQGNPDLGMRDIDQSLEVALRTIHAEMGSGVRVRVLAILLLLVGLMIFGLVIYLSVA